MRMDGKIVLVTGANSGVGFAAVRRLAELGAAMVMVCRDATRGEAAAKEVAMVATGPAPMLLLADLLSQDSIRLLCDKVHDRFDRIDVLLNNAGAMFDRRELSVDGIEKTLAVNHLAPFLLTALLLDVVRKGRAPRIITVASESHSDSIDFANLQGERHYNFFRAYNLSKLGNILFTYELARRLQGTGITANCVSPGPTVTCFGDQMRGLPGLFPRVMKRIPFLLRSPEEGARTLVYAASAPELAAVSGRFFLRCRERQTKPITYDSKVAQRLWEVSKSLVGAKGPTSFEGIRAPAMTQATG
jgi:retinol dehydrogenase 12